MIFQTSLGSGIVFGWKVSNIIPLLYKVGRDNCRTNICCGKMESTTRDPVTEHLDQYDSYSGCKIIVNSK